MISTSSGPIAGMLPVALRLAGRWLGFSDGHYSLNPLLGGPAARDGRITLLLSLLPGGALVIQLALDSLPLLFGPAECLISGDPTMRQLGFQSLDRRLSLGKLSLDLLAH